jgi:hypothetical protein
MVGSPHVMTFNVCIYWFANNPYFFTTYLSLILLWYHLFSYMLYDRPYHQRMVWNQIKRDVIPICIHFTKWLDAFTTHIFFRQEFSFMARLHWAECHSECFPNTKVARFSKQPECPAECVYPQCITECFPFAFRMFSVWVPNGFRIHQMISE